MVPLKHRNSFCRTFEMPLINCEIRVKLSCSEKCVIASNTSENQKTKAAIADTKRYIPLKTFSAQDNAKLLEQLKSGFKRTTN